MPPARPGGKRDFGFVHYAERSSALKAVKETEKYEVDGTFVFFSLFIWLRMEYTSNIILVL